MRALILEPSSLPLIVWYHMCQLTLVKQSNGSIARMKISELSSLPLIAWYHRRLILIIWLSLIPRNARI